jgi:hypothetical protein
LSVVVLPLKENKNGLFTEEELKALANPENKDFGKIGMITGWLNQGGKNVTIDQAIDLALSSANSSVRHPSSRILMNRLHCLPT